MGKDIKGKKPQNLVIAYKELGTISIDEFRDALLADYYALRDYYNVKYVKGALLTVLPTNEYGDVVRIQRPAGGTLRYIDTHHYRPACKDYDL